MKKIAFLHPKNESIKRLITIIFFIVCYHNSLLSRRNSVVLVFFNGIYKNMNFKPEEGNTYKLNVKIDEELFTATSQMQKYVEVLRLRFI